MYMYVCVYVCLCIYANIFCTHTRAHTHTHTHLYTCIYIYIHTDMQYLLVDAPNLLPRPPFGASGSVPDLFISASHVRGMSHQRRD